MKTLLISCFLTLAASLAYAGGSCCVKSGDSKDKDAGESGVAESSITLACGGDKDGSRDSETPGLSEPVTTLAACGCGGDNGDKKGEKFSIRDTLLA